MARPLRIEYKGVFYHATSLGNERRRICFAKLDYGRFNEKGRRYHCQFVLIQGLTPFFSQSDPLPRARPGLQAGCKEPQELYREHRRYYPGGGK